MEKKDLGHLNIVRSINEDGLDTVNLDIQVDNGKTAQLLIEAGIHAFYEFLLEKLEADAYNKEVYLEAGVKSNDDLVKLIIRHCVENATR